jgi:hypothetical protein
MTNSLQAHTKSDQQFQIRIDLGLMTISIQTHTKTPSKLKLCDKKFALWPNRELLVILPLIADNKQNLLEAQRFKQLTFRFVGCEYYQLSQTAYL